MLTFLHWGWFNNMKWFNKVLNKLRYYSINECSLSTHQYKDPTQTPPAMIGQSLWTSLSEVSRSETKRPEAGNSIKYVVPHWGHSTCSKVKCGKIKVKFLTKKNLANVRVLTLFSYHSNTVGDSNTKQVRILNGPKTVRLVNGLVFEWLGVFLDAILYFYVLVLFSNGQF